MGAAVSCLAKVARCWGHLTTAGILLAGDVAVTLTTKTCGGLVSLIDCVLGSGKDTAWRKAKWHPQLCASEPLYRKGEEELGVLDTESMLKSSTFPIRPEELVRKAKAVIESEFGTKPGDDGSCLADDFQFVAPIVGPLCKREFRAAFGSFKVKEAFPDMKDNSWWQVDPLEPNRVWWISRVVATQTGTLNMGPSGVKPTGKKVSMPPQAQSMLFNEQGQCYTLTVGYCMDKRIGNTEGLGGVFGLLKGVGQGLPFPEAQRLYNPSLRYQAFERIGKLGLAPGAEI